MEEKILKKNQVSKLYTELGKDYNFYAPTKEKGNLVFKKIGNAEEIEIDYFNSRVPPKDVLFPQKEVLYEYTIEDKDVKITDRTDLDQKNIIFGIRPCDAHSFELLENFFGFGEFKDDLFLEKKKNTTLIGIACNMPKTTCFCTSVEGHPFQKDNLDIMLVDLGDKYLVESVSENGRDLVKKLSWLSDAKKEDIQKAEELSKQSEESFVTKLDLKDLDKVLDPNFEHEIWNEISETCIGCGTCSFLCPTCTCFDVIDENDPDSNRGRRIRIWDTCQSCLYTQHTSGHNPRNSCVERCRNRIMHKFSYYPENYNLIGCVGCGRCIQLCPVNNDLRTILEKVIDIKKEEEKVKVA